MNKNQLSAPVPLISTRVFSTVRAVGEMAIKRMACYFEALLGESVSHSRAIWIAVCVLSFSVLLVFLTTYCIPGILLTLGSTYYSAKNGKLFYENHIN